MRLFNWIKTFDQKAVCNTSRSCMLMIIYLLGLYLIGAASFTIEISWATAQRQCPLASTTGLRYFNFVMDSSSWFTFIKTPKMKLFRGYKFMWMVGAVFFILLRVTMGLLSDYKICGDSECESKMKFWGIIFIWNYRLCVTFIITFFPNSCVQVWWAEYRL